MGGRPQELQAASALPAEAAPNHQLGGVLHTLPCKLGVKLVRLPGPPAAVMLVAKGELEVALIREHHLFPLLNSPEII